MSIPVLAQKRFNPEPAKPNKQIDSQHSLGAKSESRLYGIYYVEKRDPERMVY